LKVLLDTCLSPRAKTELEMAGHDVVWAGDWPTDPGDEEILSRANDQGRVVVTIDKDFGELAILRGQSHCGILRLVGFRAGQQGPACRQILAGYFEAFAQGAILTAEPGRIRIRPPTEETANE
jgi:predicted nuclease of predicted toxin-antitoxin system